jgi:hypothetical protein
MANFVTSGSDLPQQSGLLSAFSAIGHLRQASATSKATPLSLVSPTACRAVSALSKYLRPALSGDPSYNAASSRLQALQVASALLPYLLSTVVPILSAKVAKTPEGGSPASLALASFLGAVGEEVLKPLVCSLRTLSALHCTRLFSATANANNAAMIGVGEARGTGPQQQQNDARTPVLTLLRTIATLTGELCQPAVPAVQVHFRRLATRTALDAARELETLGTCSDDDADAVDAEEMMKMNDDMSSCIGETDKSETDGRRSRDEQQQQLLFWRRCAALAKKDAAWYLCNTLHTVLPFLASSFVEAEGEACTSEVDALLEKAFLTSLSRAVGCRWTMSANDGDHVGAGDVERTKSSCWDEVSEGLVLAVVERAMEMCSGC